MATGPDIAEPIDHINVDLLAVGGLSKKVAWLSSSRSPDIFSRQARRKETD